MGLVVDSYRFAAAPSGVTITDSFDRADSVSTMGNTDTGQTWVPNSGTWGITTNQAYSVSAGTQATTVVDSGISDCIIEFTFTSLGDGGVCFRSTDNDNHFVSNTTNLFRKESGSFNSIGTFSTSFSTGNTLKVVLSGSSITVYRNDASVLAVTSAFNDTATKHGIRSHNGTNYFDDFSITE